MNYTLYRTVVYRAVSEHIAAGDGVAMEQGNAKRSTTEHTAIAAKSSNLEKPKGQLLSNIDLQTIQLDTAGQIQHITQGTQNLEMLPIKTAYLNIPARRINIHENDLVLMPLRRSRVPWQLLLIPRKFRLGAGGGLAIPSAAQFSENSGFVAALTGELAFSEQLALTLEGAYSGISFKGDVYNETLGLPQFPSPGDDYVLKYFEIDEGLKPILQLSAGLRYWLRSAQKISPYIGLGYAAQWHPEFELKLEYVHQSTGDEAEFSIEAPSLGSPISLLDFNAGVRYRFLPHLSLQTGTFYQFKMEANQPGIPRFWGIKSAVMYEL